MTTKKEPGAPSPTTGTEASNATLDQATLVPTERPKDSTSGSKTVGSPDSGLMPASVPTIRLGNRRMALEVSLKNGKVIAVCREVTAVLDDDLKPIGWRPVFRGFYLSGSPEDLSALGSELALRLAKRRARA